MKCSFASDTLRRLQIQRVAMVELAYRDLAGVAFSVAVAFAEAG
jgi:hypothetical protein